MQHNRHAYTAKAASATLAVFYCSVVGGDSMPRPYNKQPLSFARQVRQLTDRGLHVADALLAEETLSRINYYRLSAYWYPFRVRKAGNRVDDAFMPGASFERAVELYEFDRRLRLLVMDAIERVEVLIRTRLAYFIAHQYGPFGHLNPAHFHPGFDHAKWKSLVDTESTRSTEAFIEHYRNHYLGFPSLPIWMVTEVMSLGTLSHFYRGMSNPDKRSLSMEFQLHPKRLGEWLHCLTYIRNVCAHHSRLWNRELAIKPDPKGSLWAPPVTPTNERIFFVLLMLRFLLRVGGGHGDDWQLACNDLILPIIQEPSFRLAMGFPTDWLQHPLWV